jgi:colicin import membrane protein
MRISALLLTSLLAAGRAAALPQELNQITKIDVQESGAAIVITIAGSKPPSFTTFPLEAPPRFVVDFNDATLVKVPDEIPVGDGTINLIRTVNYSGAATSIARVMIAFLRPVDPPDLQAVGNAVVLKIARLPAAKVAAAPAAPAPATAAAEKSEPAAAAATAPSAVAAAAEKAIAAVAGEANAQREATTDADAKAPDLAEETARQERENEEAKAWKAARRAEASAAPEDAKVKVTRLNDDAAAQEEAKRAVERLSRRKAEVEARLKVARARDARLKELGAPASGPVAKAPANGEAEAIAAAAKAAEAGAAEAKLAEARAKVEADAKARAEARANAQRDAAESARAERERKDAARRELPDRVKAAKAEKAAALQAAKAAKADKLAAAKAAKADKLAAKAAKRPAGKLAKRPPGKLAKPAKRPAPAGAPTRPAAVPAQHELREVGFKQLPGGSRVFLRLSSPPRFTISEAGEKVLQVEIENTRIARRNDARPLDTSSFPSAVARVTPRAAGSSTIVEITLREKVGYQQRIEGDVLAIDFDRPATARVRPPGATPAALEEPALPSDASGAPDGEARP